ncbi:MAG: hypothetical protein R3341_00225 [Methylophaga sp.]|nr:hypothetical protein [Methylophaga sp.]
MHNNVIPIWLKLSYTLLVFIIVPVYWRELGPGNFLWFSDIALISLVAAVWLESRLISSTMAVSVLFFELAWALDFFSGGKLMTIAAYVFAEDEPWVIRVLSGSFHLVLPPLLFYLLLRLGYDRRAFKLQIVIALIVLPLTFVLTGPADNINWVYGPGQPQEMLPPLVYLGLFFVTLFLGVYLPSHLLFKRFFTDKSLE